MKKGIVVCVAAIAFSAGAGAKEMTYERRDNGLLGTMVRAGCARRFVKEWISPTMLASHLLEADLLRLQTGRLIRVPSGCVIGPPAAAYRKLSREVLANEDAVLEVRELRQTKLELHDELAARTTDLAEAAAVREAAEAKAKALAREIETQWKPKLAAAQARGSGWRIIFALFIGAAVIGAIAWFLFITPLREEVATLEKNRDEDRERQARRNVDVIEISSLGVPSIPVEYLGDTYRFNVEQVACPECPEKKVKPAKANMRNHLEKHVHLRIKEKPAAEIKELLGVS